ncbi:MAG: YraN family protein [Lachnospirales bacterium]
MNKREIGSKYEDLATSYLINKNYEILERNYTKRCGEIDIISKKSNIVTFVEVKYRKNSIMYYPRESVTSKKQQKIIETAKIYIYDNEIYCNCNYIFDIIEIVGDNEINHIINAFS